MQISEIEASLLDFSDFEEAESVARAKSFITAAKRWLILRADSATHQSSSMTIGKAFVQDMLKRAQDFVAANSRNGGVRFLGVGKGFR
jgi:hypothetical protein